MCMFVQIQGNDIFMCQNAYIVDILGNIAINTT